jgi:NitT/TauT family transport system substrate-binding protein
MPYDHSPHEHRDVAHASRREFLCHCCVGGVVTAAMLSGINYPAKAGEVTFKVTAGTGLCNLAIFLAHKRKYAEPDGVHLTLVSTPTVADITTIFGAGLVDISSIAYTNFYTIYDKGAPVKIISGSGAQGCVIVAQPGIDSAQKVRGKSFGTFQADTLEVLPYDWLKAHGIAWTDVDVRFFQTSPELTQAFIARQIDLICHIEPYATQALRGVPGAVMLSDGTDVYKKRYTDCVIAASDRVINNHRNEVKALLKALMVAQRDSERDRVSACKDTIGTYYKTDFETLLDASTKQYLMVDQMDNEQFMIDRSKSMVELGYIKKPVDKGAFDWSLLKEVIAENRELYRSLIVA